MRLDPHNAFELRNRVEKNLAISFADVSPVEIFQH